MDYVVQLLISGSQLSKPLNLDSSISFGSGFSKENKTIKSSLTFGSQLCTPKVLKSVSMISDNSDSTFETLLKVEAIKEKEVVIEVAQILSDCTSFVNLYS